MAALDFLDGALEALAASGLERGLRRIDSRQAAEIELGGRRVINFASNNYLGLAGHAALGQAAAEAAERWGAGTGASRLIVGNQAEHEQLELETARFHGGEAAIAFNTGYHANVGVLSALAGPGDLIVSDQLNHASLIDGCRLSRAQVEIYRHRDVGHAAELLAAPARRRFLVSESLFSMDGDRAPLSALASLAQKRDAVLVLDEAHAVGALGPGGRGLAAEAGVRPDVLIATYGKSFGSFGGYAVGEERLRRWLISRSRAFIFTTGLPAFVVAASRAGLALASGPDGQVRRERLASRVARLSRGLANEGWLDGSSGEPASAILPIPVGDDRRVMEVSAALLELGLLVQGIRPPTVPRGTARLRIGCMADHSDAQIDQLLAALGRLDVPRGTFTAPARTGP